MDAPTYRPLYGIGCFSKLTRLSVKALRHYDAVGLLRPAHVDRMTRYRYYSAVQLEEVNRILVLKDLGFALRDIRMLIAEKVPQVEMREFLRQRREDLERSIRLDRERLARVDARLELLERSGEHPVEVVALREVAPWYVASLRDKLATHDECKLLLEELMCSCGRARQHTRGAIWHACAKGAIDCEAFVLLTAPVGGLHWGAVDRRGRVRLRQLPACRVASLVYRGDDDYLSAYSAMRAWIAASGLTIRGPKREIFLAEKGPGGQSVTEIQFPIDGEPDRLPACA